MVPCAHCKKPTSNPKFCSKSCAAKYNNSVKPKRALEGTCKGCSIAISTSRTYCNKCLVTLEIGGKGLSPLDNKTLAEAENRQGLKANRYRNVRDHAVRVIKKNKVHKVCKICGYSTYVEVHHIKPISEFNKDTLVKDVNALHNLVYLCPNHHKEVDLGLLGLDS